MKEIESFCMCLIFVREKQLFEVWFIGGKKVQVTDLLPTPLSHLLFPGMYALQGSEGICGFFFLTPLCFFVHSACS